MKPIIVAALVAVAAPAAAAPYRALGTEPFWSLTIDDRITYEPATGRKISARTPRPAHMVVGTRYTTPFVTVEIRNQPCSDGMSDRRYPDSVTVRIGLKRLSGCGGVPLGNGPWQPAPLPPGADAKLDGTRWMPLTIDKRPLFQMARARVAFDRGTISANVGCNGMGGRYRIERGRLFAPKLSGTQMACPPAVMVQDRAFADLLVEGAAMRPLPNGRMELVSRRHRAVLAKAR